MSIDNTLVVNMADCGQSSITAGRSRTVAYTDSVYDRFGNRILIQESILSDLQVCVTLTVLYNHNKHVHSQLSSLNNIDGMYFTTWGNVGFSLVSRSTTSAYYRLQILYKNMPMLIYGRSNQQITDNIQFCINADTISWSNTNLSCPRKYSSNGLK